MPVRGRIESSRRRRIRRVRRNVNEEESNTQDILKYCAVMVDQISRIALIMLMNSWFFGNKCSDCKIALSAFWFLKLLIGVCYFIGFCLGLKKWIGRFDGISHVISVLDTDQSVKEMSINEIQFCANLLLSYFLGMRCIMLDIMDTELWYCALMAYFVGPTFFFDIIPKEKESKSEIEEEAEENNHGFSKWRHFIGRNYQTGSSLCLKIFLGLTAPPFIILRVCAFSFIIYIDRDLVKKAVKEIARRFETINGQNDELHDFLKASGNKFVRQIDQWRRGFQLMRLCCYMTLFVMISWIVSLYIGSMMQEDMCFGVAFFGPIYGIYILIIGWMFNSIILNVIFRPLELYLEDW